LDRDPDGRNRSGAVGIEPVPHSASNRLPTSRPLIFLYLFCSDGHLSWQKDAATLRPVEYGRYVGVRTAWIERLRAGVPQFLPGK